MGAKSFGVTRGHTGSGLPCVPSRGGDVCACSVGGLPGVWAGLEGRDCAIASVPLSFAQTQSVLTPCGIISQIHEDELLPGHCPPGAARSQTHIISDKSADAERRCWSPYWDGMQLR